MTIETATYISDLNASNPGASDLKAEGDDHIRLTKTTLKNTFPNVAGAVTPTHLVINNLAAGTFASVPITGVTTITTSGAVGAGIAPAVQLHAKPAAGGEIMRLETPTARGSGACFMRFYDPTGSKGYVGYATATDDLYLNNQMAGALRLYTSDTQRMTITSSGLLNWTGSDINYNDGTASWYIGRSSSFNGSGTASSMGFRSEGSGFEWAFSGGAPKMTLASTGDITALGVSIARVKTAATARISTTTLAADPHLTMTLPVGTWNVRVVLHYSVAASGGADGFQYNFTFGGTITDDSQFSYGFDKTIASQGRLSFTTGGSISTNTTGSTNWLVVEGVCVVTVAGTLAFQWAQLVSGAHNLTLAIGSNMRATKVG